MRRDSSYLRQRFLSLLFLAVWLPETNHLTAGESLRDWPEYQAIMWVGEHGFRNREKAPLFFQRLQEMGVSGVTFDREADPKPVVDAGFSFYIENIVNRGLCLKWNSNVSD